MGHIKILEKYNGNIQNISVVIILDSPNHKQQKQN